VLNPDKSLWRANDDGEPSSTAGKPILGQIQSNDLTNTLIIVVRYFGGTKLGVPGLIKAYKSAAKDAIRNSEFIIKTMLNNYQIFFDYAQMNIVMRLIKEYNIKIIDTNFQTNCNILISVAKSKSILILEKFKKNHNVIVKEISNNI
jgi:uncharacterized YigZ family protein